MPYKTVYLEEEGGVVTTYWGKVTDAEIVNSGSEKYARIDELQSYHYALTDLTGVTEFNVSPEGIRGNAAISDMLLARNKTIIVAFVVPSDLMFGMSRMWQGYASAAHDRSEVFRTRAEAQDWIEKCLGRRQDDHRSPEDG